MLIDIRCLFAFVVFGILYGWFVASPLVMNVTDDLSESFTRKFPDKK